MKRMNFIIICCLWSRFVEEEVSKINLMCNCKYVLYYVELSDTYGRMNSLVLYIICIYNYIYLSFFENYRFFYVGDIRIYRF